MKKLLVPISCLLLLGSHAVGAEPRRINGDRIVGDYSREHSVEWKGSTLVTRNCVIGGYGWDGWGCPGYVHFGGTEYGLFARYTFDELHTEARRIVPWWSFAVVTASVARS